MEKFTSMRYNHSDYTTNLSLLGDGEGRSLHELQRWVKEVKSGQTAWRGKRVDLPRRQQTAVLHTVVSSGENNSLLNLLICASVPACGCICSDSDICGTAM